MAESTGIEWADHTFNPWIGCAAVSPACDNCYAERFAKRLGVEWGPHADRRFAAETTWKNTETWNRKAAREGVRRRVFGPSLADPFDNAVPIAWLLVYLNHIRQMEALDWLLLTKRPQNILRRLREAREDATPKWDAVRWDTGPVAAWLDRWLAGEAPANVWLGTTAENQTEANRRIPHLLWVPARMRFLSCEPLLGPLDLTRISGQAGFDPHWSMRQAGIGWVIAGGESGPKARPSHPDWFTSLRDQCAAAGVPFFFKQWGDWGPSEPAKPGVTPHAIANDGTLYRMTDLAYPDGARYGEAIRAGHAHARLHSTFRVGKKRAGRELDGREHSAVPGGGHA